MGKIFDVENPVWMFLNRMTDLFLTSLLWILFSIPIITAGAASAGFYNGAMRIHQDRSTGIWRDFWAGFRGNFKRATVLWLLQLGLTAVLIFDMWVCYAMNSSFSWFILTINGMLLLMLICISFFIYPLVACYDFGVKRIFREAAAIACGYLPHTICLLVISIAGLAAAWLVDYMVLFVPAIAGYLVACVCVWIFNKSQKAGETMEAREVNGQDA